LIPSFLKKQQSENEVSGCYRPSGCQNRHSALGQLRPFRYAAILVRSEAGAASAYRTLADLAGLRQPGSLPTKATSPPRREDVHRLRRQLAGELPCGHLPPQRGPLARPKAHEVARPQRLRVIA
jgi:hypothetical protein